MKRILFALLLVAVLTLAGCGGAKTAPVEADVDFDTLGDLFAWTAAHEDVFPMSSFDGSNTYVCVLDYEGTPIRVVAELPADVAEAVNAVSWEDDDRDAKVNALLSPVAPKRIDDLSAYALSAAEIEKLIGKTGAELIADGFEVTGYASDGETTTTYYLDKGMFSYAATFNTLETPGEDDEYASVIGDKQLTSLTRDSLNYRAVEPDFFG